MIEDEGQREESTTAIDSDLASALTYLLGFVSGVVFLIVEIRNKTVRFHAYQSIATFGGLFILSVLAPFIPLLGGLISWVLPFASAVLWVILIVQAFRGERLVLPLVGEWAEERAQLERLS